MKLINLLPKPRQEELRYEVILRGLYIVIWISLFSFAMVFLVQIIAKLYLQKQGSSIQASIEELKGQVNKKDNADVKNQVKELNATITDFNNLASGAPKWSKVLKAFVKLPPTDIKISTFLADINRKTIYVSGFSPSRELVIEFYNNILNDDQDFYNVDYPLDNVAKAKDVSFHFTFDIRDDLLK